MTTSTVKHIARFEKYTYFLHLLGILSSEEKEEILGKIEQKRVFFL